MKLLMLGMERHNSEFSALGKILELEKIYSDILYFDDCSEEKLIKKLKKSELFLMCPDNLAGEKESDKDCGSRLFEAVAAGYILAHKGRILIFSSEPEKLSGIFYGEPVVGRIGEAIAYFRREKRVYESNKSLLEARRIISDASLSFSRKGLIEAVENGMYKETQAFLSASFSTETENEEGVALISIAVRNGDLEICRLLMSYDASLNIIARDRVTSPVIDAVTAAKAEIAELLIDAGADLNFRNRNGQTALIVAIGSRMEEIASMLIDKGADLTIKDSLGMDAYGYSKLFSLSGLLNKLEKLI